MFWFRGCSYPFPSHKVSYHCLIPCLTFAVCSLRLCSGLHRGGGLVEAKSLVVLEMDVQPYTMTASLKWNRSKNRYIASKSQLVEFQRVSHSIVLQMSSLESIFTLLLVTLGTLTTSIPTTLRYNYTIISFSTDCMLLVNTCLCSVQGYRKRKEYIAGAQSSCDRSTGEDWSRLLVNGMERKRVQSLSW